MQLKKQKQALISTAMVAAGEEVVDLVAVVGGFMDAAQGAAEQVPDKYYSCLKPLNERIEHKINCGLMSIYADQGEEAGEASVDINGYGGGGGGHCRWGCCGAGGRYCRCCYNREEAQAVQFGN